MVDNGKLADYHWNLEEKLPEKVGGKNPQTKIKKEKSKKGGLIEDNPGELQVLRNLNK